MSATLVVVAGPNGAGKTTLTRDLIADGWILGNYINPDDIARDIAGSYDSILPHHTRTAQGEADRLRRQYLDAGDSLAFETVMSHPSKIEFMRLARSRGYVVHLHYVGIEGADLSMMRVFSRIGGGGHSVPQQKLAPRFHRTMDLLRDAIAIANHAVIYDNSDTPFGADGSWRMPRVAEYVDGARIFRASLPGISWPDRYLP